MQERFEIIIEWLQDLKLGHFFEKCKICQFSKFCKNMGGEKTCSSFALQKFTQCKVYNHNLRFVDL